MYKRALVSVYDKTGLVDFLKPLVEKGLDIVSTGGTADFLKSSGFKLEKVKDITAYPEVLSGRVKTLHPHIFIPILARHWVKEDQNVLKRTSLKAFDLLVVNLYPFEKKALNKPEREKMEWVDIGGASLLRAGAKNYFQVMTVCEISDYSKVQKNNDLKLRKQMAVKVFEKLAKYNLDIAKNLETESTSFSFKGKFFKKLRYGENPHQSANWFYSSSKGIHCAKVIQGKPLSYNNILDFDTSVQVIKDFKSPCVVAVKHSNPCGVGISKDISSALKKALSADPLSVFGGVIALNQKVDKKCIDFIEGIFLEGLIAPSFTSEALAELAIKKRNLRVLQWPEMLSPFLGQNSIKEVSGGFLIQNRDQVTKNFDKNWEIFSDENLTENVKQDLVFSWKICSHLKSNAIAIVKNRQTLGLGMGQVNRIDSVKIALSRIKQFHPGKEKSLILASEAFFPFVDSIEWAKKGGVSWIIQPGGSIKDKDILKKARELGLNMVLTKQRHFKH
ncbi:MAG: bifunctional phosphoribosylaminoimidazolecarboxamide formyltransferase/IMP cyclohydrolase [Bdellovibrionales bacterium]|nr:bifunctional phosphoribosylaminoimidazolecarboxamide formyltransferase/IMP cyclohydrolase [Bdellovibrionales bacterium]